MFKNASVIKAWKVSKYCSQVLSASNHIFRGTDQEIREEVVETLTKSHGLEREKMLVPVSQSVY